MRILLSPPLIVAFALPFAACGRSEEKAAAPPPAHGEAGHVHAESDEHAAHDHEGHAH